jgi:hypothetical protein
MADERDIAQKLVFALRRIVADAEGAALHSGNRRRWWKTLRQRP